MDDYGLRGRVENVFLADYLPNGMVRGNFNGGKFLVFSPRRFVGGDCLVRFDLKNNKRHRCGSFLTSKVPKDFSGLGADDYVLCALWSPETGKNSSVPSVEELEVCYNPGRKSAFHYLMSGSTRKCGRVRVNFANAWTRSNCSFSRIIRKDLPHPYRSARLVVAEGEQELVRFEDAVKNEGLTPVRLESLVELNQP